MRRKKPYVPRLYHGAHPTKALRILELCNEDGGYVPPYITRRQYRPGEMVMACYKLAMLGLAEQRRSGPRGGKRWHATELGQQVLRILKESPSPLASLLILGLPREVIGKWGATK